MSSSRPDASAASSEPTTEPLPSNFNRRYTSQARPYSIWDTPTTIKQLFARFPLKSSLTEPWPAYLTRLSSVQKSKRIQFWTNTLSDSALAPSYNVNCLKYQTLLHAKGIRFEVVRTAADGAPDGRLPFLLVTNARGQVNVVRSAEVEGFVADRMNERGGEHGSGAMQEEKDVQTAGLGILDKDVRAAWLYACYLIPENFREVVFALYVASTTHASLSHYAMLDNIYSDARDEFSKLVSTQDLGRTSWRDGVPPAERDLAISLNKRAGKALDHLIELLDGRTFFSGTNEPGLLDAAVFAYTHILTKPSLGKGIEWKDTRLGDEFRRREALVRHERAVYGACFEGGFVDVGDRKNTSRSNDSYSDLQGQSMYQESQTSFSEINESSYQDSQHSYEEVRESSYPTESQHSYEEIRESSYPTESQDSYTEISDSLVTETSSNEPQHEIEEEPQPEPEPQNEPMAVEPEEQDGHSEEDTAAMASSHLFA